MTTQTVSDSQKKHVAILLGGQSPEHSVSINSGCSLLNHIDRNLFVVEAIYIDIDGHWWQYPQQTHYKAEIFNKETASAIANRCTVIPDACYQLVQLPSLNKIHCEACFSIIHGSSGEDGKLQGLFELANLPYVGTDVAGSAVAMNKVIMKDILNSNDIPTANAGAMTVSHANDSFFWIVSQFSRMSVSQAYKTHTIATGIQGFTSILFIWLLTVVLL